MHINRKINIYIKFQNYYNQRSRLAISKFNENYQKEETRIHLSFGNILNFKIIHLEMITLTVEPKRR